MRNRFFVDVINGQLVGQGVVLEPEGAEHHRIQYLSGSVPIEQVCPNSAMTSFILFRAQEHMDTWLKENTPQPEPPEDSKPTEVESVTVEGTEESAATPELVALFRPKQSAEDMAEAMDRVEHLEDDGAARTHHEHAIDADPCMTSGQPE